MQVTHFVPLPGDREEAIRQVHAKRKVARRKEEEEVKRREEELRQDDSDTMLEVGAQKKLAFEPTGQEAPS